MVTKESHNAIGPLVLEMYISCGNLGNVTQIPRTNFGLACFGEEV